MNVLDFEIRMLLHDLLRGHARREHVVLAENAFRWLTRAATDREYDHRGEEKYRASHRGAAERH
jgi:hypothetical protein